MYNIYVYCDVCSNTYVGDTMVPLLRTISFNSQSSNYGEAIWVLYNNPIYVPLNKRFIDNITVELYDDSGHEIPFVEDKTCVTIHFRRRQSKQV